jgi:hypothetical protein
MQIYSVYRKNNVLILNKELFEMNKPGFCRDDEDLQGKFNMCIQEIVPHLTVGLNQSFETVFVFEKRYATRALGSTLYYISSPVNILVKKERRDSIGRPIGVEELIRVVQK